MKQISLKIASVSLLSLIGCSTVPNYEKTVSKVELNRYMVKWYVIASRPTFMEEGAHNAFDSYSFDAANDRIDIDFSCNEGSFEGPLKKIPQTGWIENKDTHAHWKVKPNWWWFPFKFDYLIIALDPNYEWTAVGVPNQKYLWIMSQKPQMSDKDLNGILKSVHDLGYNTDNVQRVPQKLGK